MKKHTFSFALFIMMSLGLMLSSCEKEPGLTPNSEIPTKPNSSEPDMYFSIIGHWRLDKATQLANGNEVDMTNFYTQNFQLIFLEDGTLITSDGINESEMQWTLDGDQLSFIQAPGIDPVMYIVRVLTDTSLSIENGTGTEYITTMDFHRE